MKFVSLGYMEEAKWEAMSEEERNAMIEECLAYDEELQRNGHWTDAGVPLKSARTAKTLRFSDGKPTDRTRRRKSNSVVSACSKPVTWNTRSS